MTWQTIESAPKDGTSILICCPGVYPAFFQVVFWNKEKPAHPWEIEDSGGVAYAPGFPKFWMPLPAPPQIEEA